MRINNRFISSGSATAGQVLTADGLTNATWETPSGSSPGDISETSFIAADDQSSAADVTGLLFANATVRSFNALISIVRDTDYSIYELKGIQKSSSWEMSQDYVGDITGITFSITNAGQVQYVSSNTGFTADVHFRAITTSV